jgi:hypothetical protein
MVSARKTKTAYNDVKNFIIYLKNLIADFTNALIYASLRLKKVRQKQS